MPSRDHLKRAAIALLFLALVILLLVIVARLVIVAQRLDWENDSSGALTAIATTAGALGAWVTGAALVWIAYQQWQLRREEHDLLHNPRLIVQSASELKLGRGVYDPTEYRIEYPYRIEWTISIQNTSEIPICMEHAQVLVELAHEPRQRHAILTPQFCHMSPPGDTTVHFWVSRDSPRQITWIVEGASADSPFSYVAGNQLNSYFRLRCRVFAKLPSRQGGLVESAAASDEFLLTADAQWGQPVVSVKAA